MATDGKRFLVGPRRSGSFADLVRGPARTLHIVYGGPVNRRRVDSHERARRRNLEETSELEASIPPCMLACLDMHCGINECS